MKHIATHAFILFFLFTINLCLNAQTIRYVKEGGTGNGSSWSTASGDLQAIINASASGNEVWVAAGTYLPTLDEFGRVPPVGARSKTFSMKSGVGIYGGFIGTTETQRSQRNWKNNVTTLSGDIGTANDNSDNSYHVVFNSGNNLTSTAALDGFIITGGNANGSFSGALNGGGVSNYLSSPLFANCIFAGNRASSAGAGMINQNASPTIINCSFTGNSCDRGAGMYNFASSSPVLTNCTFWGNSGIGTGGAIRNESPPTLTNCIIWGNSSGIGGSAAFVTYSIVQGGYTGTGNLDKNPLFVNAAAGDLHLQPCSPAINKGENAANITEKDLDGNIRKVGTIDMGAYEYQGTPATAPAIIAQPLATQSVCSNNTPAGLSVAATGEALLYQWYSNTTNSNIGGTAIINAAASTYTPSTTTTGTAYYYVVVSGTCPPAATSLVAMVTISPSPNRLYVNASATGANTGLSWQDAFTDLQSALNYACLGNQSEIWVAAGTYKPTTGTDRNASFVMKNGVAIYGGFTGGETNLSQRDLKTAVTILSGDLNGDDAANFTNNSDNSYHVVYNNNNSLNGSAVLDGFTITAANNNLPDREDNGGGMSNDGSSPLVINCTFLGNVATGGGGAMYNYTSSPTVINCVFLGNRANIGGAMYNYSGCSPALTNCSFSGNAATSGGAIYNHYYCFPTLTNCILWGNAGGEIYDYFNAQVAIYNSIVQGGCPEYAFCSDVLNQDPLFVSATDLHLQPCSPAIDAGSDAANTTLTDLDGNQRKIDAITGGSHIDMGAYEYQQVLPIFYLDNDGDGFGNPANTRQACSAPDDYVADNGDCNDNLVVYQDSDGDGFGSDTKVACGGVANSDDCDDNAVTHQDSDSDGFGSATKIACGGVSNNTDCDDNQTTYADSDSDGYGSQVKVTCGGVTNNSDCNDNNSMLNPVTAWVLDTDSDSYYNGSPVTQCTSPGQGYVVKGNQQAGDCNDNNKDVNPGAPEICGNKIDNNCNGQVDEGCATITVYVMPSFTKEGDKDKHPMYFALVLNKPATGTVSVQYKTLDGSAKAGSDYQAVTGTISFSKGQWLKFVQVNVYGDKKEEGNEQLYVQLSNSSGIKIFGTGKASGTILDDDGRSYTATTATGKKVQEVQETQALVVPNFLHRNEVWRILNLPAQNEIIVIDMNGRVVFKTRNYQNGHSFSNVASGLYLYQIQTKDTNGKLQAYKGKLMIVE